MTELSIRPEEIRDALQDFVKAYEPGKASTTEVGYVVDAADGIAHVEGLPGVMANELVRFGDEAGTLGLALNLDVREIGVVVLGQFTGIEEGLEVRRTGEVLSVMKTLSTDLHTTMMVVTHEMGFAREVADRMAFFHDGRILEEGPPDQLITSPEHAETRAFLDAVL